MDPFTQRMLEKAEQRSRALGISNASKYPLADASSDVNASNALMPNQHKTNQKERIQKQPQQPQQKTSVISASSIGGKIIERIPADASKILPNTVVNFSNVNKENVDLGIEINIMTNNDVEVQVEVEERDITDSEEDCEDNSKLPKEAINQPLAKIRDTSRNRLQRLGALYSNTDDLSSPIHRTEAQFHAGSSDDACLNDSPSKSKQRHGRLAALANSINQWEDDTQHHHISTIPPPKPDLPSRKLADTAKNCQKITQSQATVPNQTTEEVKQNDSCDRISSSKTKQLNWDPKVINSLEAQGFQRRESTTTKLAYDYTNKECNVNRERDLDKPQKEQTKLCTNPVNNNISKNLKNTVNEELEKPKLANVKPGLVSGHYKT
ncbi:anillin-like [Teleopsis dalmanni]|uniref:anillin-like n=1 Tax=Teleopsis dalmanni TaxID=139649 RepID=UPI0018CD074F|nr:anillin-like [Teleopsis dalmanni]